MKITKIIFLFIISYTCSFAQKVKFETSTWSEAMAKAKQENKAIFLDIYASWCGPCKQLDKNVYPNAEVAAFMNSNFINFKVDGEVGEGVEIQNKYGLSSYPTLIFFKANGDRIYSFEGYRNPEEFIEEAKIALSHTKELTVSDLQKDFDAGNNKKDFLAQYLDARQKENSMRFDNGKILDLYAQSLNKKDAENEEIISRFWKNLPSVLFAGEAYHFIKENLKAMNEKAGENGNANPEEFLKSIDSYIGYYDIKRAFETDNLANINVASTNFLKITGNGSEWFSMPRKTIYSLWREYYKAKNEIEKELNLIEGFINENYPKNAAELETLAKNAALYEQQLAAVQQGETATEDEKSTAKQMFWDNVAFELNDAAWTFFENTEDKQRLNVAVAWSKRTLEINDQAAFLDTYANLLYALGNLDEAVQCQERALKKATEQEEDLTDFKKNLSKMKVALRKSKPVEPVAHTLEALKTDFDNYNKLTKEIDIDGFLDYVHPEIFTLASREQLYDFFDKTFNNPELPVRIDSIYTPNFHAVEHFGENSYSLVKLSIDMSFNFAKILESSEGEEAEKDLEKRLLDTYKMKYGEEKLQYDQVSKWLKISNVSNFTYCVAEKGFDTWKFIKRDENMQGLVNKVVPKAVQEKFE